MFSSYDKQMDFINPDITNILCNRAIVLPKQL